MLIKYVVELCSSMGKYPAYNFSLLSIKNMFWVLSFNSMNSCAYKLLSSKAT